MTYLEPPAPGTRVAVCGRNDRRVGWPFALAPAEGDVVGGAFPPSCPVLLEHCSVSASIQVQFMLHAPVGVHTGVQGYVEGVVEGYYPPSCDRPATGEKLYWNGSGFFYTSRGRVERLAALWLDDGGAWAIGAAYVDISPRVG